MSMCSVAHMYESGTGVEKDEDEAFYYYKKSVDAGCVLAMTFLANCYLLGKGTPPNEEKYYELNSLYNEKIDAYIEEQMNSV